LAIRERVERLQPVAAWIWLQGDPACQTALNIDPGSASNFGSDALSLIIEA
jgi:hypothetical protein